MTPSINGTGCKVFIGILSNTLCSFRIPDPEASKPDDWDEDAPREILDEDAEKPEGWLDNEPEEIDDPGAFLLS